jgi:hypothetical protein
MLRNDARSKCCIFEDTPNKKYYFWLDPAYNLDRVEVFKRLIVQAHVQLDDIKNLMKKGSIYGDDGFIKTFFDDLASKSTFKISPYDSNNSIINSFGTFFSGTSSTKVATTSGSNITVVYIIALVIAFIAFAIYYRVKKGKKNE